MPDLNAWKRQHGVKCISSCSVLTVDIMTSQSALLSMEGLQLCKIVSVLFLYLLHQADGSVKNLWVLWLIKVD